MAVDIDELKKRYDCLYQERSNWDALWQEIADYMVPWRNAINTSKTPGQKLTDRIFDSTAPQALTTASSAVHGAVTPSTLRWFSLKVGDAALLDEEGVAPYLDEISNIIFRVISNSNFDSEAQELYSDLLAFGTGAMAVEEADPTLGNSTPSIRFQTQQPGTFVISEGPDGRVDTIFRRKYMTVAALYKKWGDKISDHSKKALKENKPDTRVSELHAIYPRESSYRENHESVPKNERPIASVWIELSSDIPTSGSYGTEGGRLHLLKEDGLFDMPVMTPRWRKMSGEQYGRSPGMNVLPDVRTINQAVELRLKAWVLAIAPTIITPDRGVIGNIRLEPFGRIYTRPGTTIETLDIPAHFDVANFNEDQIRGVIRQGFFVDLLQLEPKSGNPRSATETAIQFQNMQRILGPVVSRLQSEFLAPLVQYVYRLLERRNVLPDPPSALLDGKASIDIIFEGPLARVQRSTDIESINQFFSLTLPLAELYEEMTMRVDPNEVLELIADAVSLPSKLLRSRAQTAELINQKRQQQAQQAAMQNMIQAAEVFQKGGMGGARPTA